MIDWKKPLRTIEGCKVRRVLCLDAIDPDGPVLVELVNGGVVRFTNEGKAAHCRTVSIENYSELSDIPVDTPIWVKDLANNRWLPRYFAGEQNGHPTCWDEGCTSKTSVSEDKVTEWKFYSLTRPEGYTHWADKLDNPKEAS